MCRYLSREAHSITKDPAAGRHLTIETLLAKGLWNRRGEARGEQSAQLPIESGIDVDVQEGLYLHVHYRLPVIQRWVAGTSLCFCMSTAMLPCHVPLMQARTEIRLWKINWIL